MRAVALYAEQLKKTSISYTIAGDRPMTPISDRIQNILTPQIAG
jgi:hypothetical protein